MKRILMLSLQTAVIWVLILFLLHTAWQEKHGNALSLRSLSGTCILSGSVL